MKPQGQPILLDGGVACYADDAAAHQFYCLPSGLSVATDDEGRYRFSLLFYQENFPDRGARMVVVLSPTYPQLSTEARSTLGADAEIAHMPFAGGSVQFLCPAFAAAADPIQVFGGGDVHIQTSLSQAEGSALRQLFCAGMESVCVAVRLTYPLVTESLPAMVRANLRKVSANLHERAVGGHLSGLQLRTLIAGLPEAALDLRADGALALVSRLDALWRCTPGLAPLIAAAAADQTTAGLIFDERAFYLRPIDHVEDAELWLDLSRPRPWVGVWEGNWSLSAFRQQIEIAGELPRYFPQVRHVPAVGSVPVLVENLLPLDAETIQEVQVTLKHKKLGSLEEEIFDHRFTPGATPVVQHSIPQIAYTPFRYEYRCRLLVAPAIVGEPAESLPPIPPWQPADQPIVRIGLDQMPYAVLFATALEGVFDLVGRVVVEFAETDAEPQVVVARAELCGANPSRWMLVRSLSSTTHAISWRPVYFADPGGQSAPVFGAWRQVERLWVALDPWEALPDKPIRIEVRVHKGNTPEIQAITVALRMGTSTQDGPEPSASWSFTDDGTHTMVIWPATLFDTSYVYRTTASLASGTALGGAWRPGQGETIEMDAEDEFYCMRQVEVTVKGPWSTQHSPDPSSHEGKVIFAEVELQLIDVSDTQSSSFTFDSENAGRNATWTVHAPRGAERYWVRVQLLSVDGHFHNFGPWPSDQERLALEIVRTLENDVAPPEFDVHEIAT